MCIRDSVANAEALAGEGRVIAMGAGHLPKEFDEGLLGMNVDETKTISWTCLLYTSRCV